MKKFTKALALSLMLILCVSIFAACTPNNADDMRKRYEEEGYTVVSLTAEQLSQYGVDAGEAEVQWAVVAMKGLLGGEMAVAICYKNKDDAKKMEDEFKNATEAEKDGAFFFRSGKVCVTATSEAALKIAK